MSLQRTVKTLLAAVLLTSLAGCTASEPEKTPAKVLAPTGAPALATLGMRDGDLAEVEYAEGQDLLAAELNKSDSDYDIILAPVNLGVKSWKESDTWQLKAVVTWGNLYVVSDTEDWNVEDNTIGAFGEGAVPGLVFSEVFPDLKCDVTFFPSAAEASQALISGQVHTALLAQPVAAAAVAKSKEAGHEVSITSDLQQLWQEKTGSANKGYPQAGVFVKKGEDESAALEAMSSFLEDPTDEELTEKIDAAGAETLGVPSTKIAVSTWKAQNIHYRPAAEVQEDLSAFLDVFGMSLPDGFIAE